MENRIEITKIMENRIEIAKIMKNIKILSKRYNKSYFDIGR